MILRAWVPLRVVDKIRCLACYCIYILRIHIAGTNDHTCFHKLLLASLSIAFREELGHGLDVPGIQDYIQLKTNEVDH